MCRDRSLACPMVGRFLFTILRVASCHSRLTLQARLLWHIQVRIRSSSSGNSFLYQNLIRPRRVITDSNHFESGSSVIDLDRKRHCNLGNTSPFLCIYVS